MVVFGAGRKDLGIKGFSLVEMMLIIVIIGILLLIASSMFTTLGKNTALSEAAGALMSDIKLAKQRSVAESVQYTITFDVANSKYTILGGTSVTKNLGDFGKGISIATDDVNKMTYPGATITFQTRGTCSAGSITLKNSLNSTVKIRTTPMGRVRIEKSIKYK